MGKSIRYILRGIAIVSVLAAKLPVILMDGKITVDELASLAKDVCAAGGWKVSMTVPANIGGQIIGVGEVEE